MRYLLTALVVLTATAAQAQPITAHRLSVYMQGGGAPTTTFDFPVANATCGQPRVNVTGTVPNPTQARWEDPANAALDCVWNDPGTGPLFALPFSPTVVYEATLRAINTAGAGAESARSNPFSRPGAVPAAPGRVRVSGS